MTDDIVARLRSLVAEFPTLNRIMDNEWAAAADEIERLREALERQRYQTISAQMDADTLKLLMKKAGRE